MSEKITIKNNIIIPGIGDDPRARELGEVLDVCSDEEIKKVVEEKERREKERKTEEQEKKSNLMGNTKAILEDLKENYVKIEENKEIVGYKGKFVHIDLPAVGNFKGYRFSYFISDDSVRKDDFELDPELEDKSYSMKDVSELLQAMNEYMKELNGENDGNMNYENELRYWETKTRGCKAGDCLRVITGLNNWCWLKDKDVAGAKGSRVDWDYNNDCRFCQCNINSRSNLFLRLSD